MNYNEALVKLNGRDKRKIGNNTWLVRGKPGEISVRLHNTDVVTLCADGTYVLCSGGWRSRTTKDRINEYAPVRVVQRNFEWTVDGYVFFDGIRVDARGNVLNADPNLIATR